MAIDAIKQIESDFNNQQAPFDDVEFPEERLLETLATDEDGQKWRMSMEDKLAAISFFCTLDYNRDANQLVDKIIEASEHGGLNIFNPHAVDKSKQGLEYLFEDISFRYPSRDAHAWHKNCHILVEKYNGKWHELMMDTGMDAPTLVERLQADDFNVLKGEKVSPMYARIIDDEVAPLSNLWELDIPVDRHIHRLTEELTNTEMDNDDVRAWWRNVAPKADVSRHIVDGGLWFIGNKWDQWGEDYWEEVTSE